MLNFENVTFSYNKHENVIEKMDLNIQAGEFVGMVGHSGIGKSTILQLALGLINPDIGSVTYYGIPCHKARKQIPFGIMLQENTLLPHLNVYENVFLGGYSGSFGLEKDEAKERTIEVLMTTEINESLWGRYPSELSGGQAQRVSLARSLNGREKMILGLDEPFASVDMLTREILYTRLEKVFQKLFPVPLVLLITHSVQEAVFLCDKIAILSGHPANISEIIIVPFDRPRSQVKEKYLFEFSQKIKDILKKCGGIVE